MAITCSCSCGRKFLVSDSVAGRKTKCPQCGASFGVPADCVLPSPTQDEEIGFAPEPEREKPRKAPLAISQPAPSQDWFQDLIQEQPATASARRRGCPHCGSNELTDDNLVCLKCGLVASERRPVPQWKPAAAEPARSPLMGIMHLLEASIWFLVEFLWQVLFYTYQLDLPIPAVYGSATFGLVWVLALARFMDVGCLFFVLSGVIPGLIGKRFWDCWDSAGAELWES